MCNMLSSPMLTSIASFLSARLINFDNSSTLTPNFNESSHSYFSNVELGHWISISATWDGSIPLNEIPSTVASKVASSTKVEIADTITFHSSGDLVLATNTKLWLLLRYRILNIAVLHLWVCDVKKIEYELNES